MFDLDSRMSDQCKLEFFSKYSASFIMSDFLILLPRGSEVAASVKKVSILPTLIREQFLL